MKRGVMSSLKNKFLNHIGLKKSSMDPFMKAV